MKWERPSYSVQIAALPHGLCHGSGHMKICVVPAYHACHGFPGADMASPRLPWSGVSRARTSSSSVNRSSGVRSEPCTATAATLIPSAVASTTPMLRARAREHEALPRNVAWCTPDSLLGRGRQKLGVQSKGSPGALLFPNLLDTETALVPWRPLLKPLQMLSEGLYTACLGRRTWSERRPPARTLLTPQSASPGRCGGEPHSR